MELFPSEPSNFSFPGALPLGDWVFRVVDYPRSTRTSVALVCTNERKTTQPRDKALNLG